MTLADRFTAKRVEIVELEVGGDEAAAACREALRALGWEVSEKVGGRICAREDPTGLGCRTTPSWLELEIHTWSPGQTAVTINVSAPGIGSIPARRAQRQTDALSRRLQAREEAIAAAEE